MKVKITRITRSAAEKLFAELVLDPENMVKLLCLRPTQLRPAPFGEDEDRRWIIKDPLMFHTLVTSMARRSQYAKRIDQFIVLLDLMAPYLVDSWELSWDTMTDMELEIHTDYQGARF